MFGTVTRATSGPVGESNRNETVPPAPAEETRARTPVMPFRLTAWWRTYSPFWMSPSRLPPSAAAWLMTCGPLSVT